VQPKFTKLFHGHQGLEQAMKKLGSLFFVLFLALVSTAAQDNPSSDEFAPLVLVRIIPMPDVQGRFDHMG
jgi:hypothetical protein